LETRNQYLKEVVQSGDHSAVFRVIQEENEIHRQRIKSVNPKLSTVVEFLPEEMNLSVIECDRVRSFFLEESRRSAVGSNAMLSI
jgi:hypothetical protein